MLIMEDSQDMRKIQILHYSLVLFEFSPLFENVLQNGASMRRGLKNPLFFS